MTFTILPKRKVNQISLYTEEASLFKSLVFNGEHMPLKNGAEYASQNIRSKELIRYYVSDKDSLEVAYAISKDHPVTFTLIEYSFDLLTHSQFTINKRAENMMPKPFVITDAIVVKKTIYIDSLQLKKNDPVTFNSNE